MPLPRLRLRPSPSGTLLVLGALLLFVSLAFVWADRAFFSTSGFTSRTTAALEQEAVQSRLAERLTDRIVEGRERLEAARPLIKIVIEGILSSSRFRDAIADAAGVLHEQLFEQRDGRLVLRIRGLLDELRGAIAAVAPEVAADLPDIDAVETDIGSARDARARLLRLAHAVDVAAYVLSVPTLAALGGAIFIAQDRREMLSDVGLALAAASAVMLVVVFLGRVLVIESVHDPANVEAVKAIYRALVDPLWDMSAIVAFVGVIMFYLARRKT